MSTIIQKKLKEKKVTERKRVSYTLPAETIAKIQDGARKRRLNMSVYLQLIIEKQLRDEEEVGE